MTYQHKPDTGSLFANDKREKDTQPNAKGSALIDGREYWLAAWTNTAADGTKYQTLRFELKDKAQADTGQPEALDDPIPF
jgi:hypothetical protein